MTEGAANSDFAGAPGVGIDVGTRLTKLVSGAQDAPQVTVVETVDFLTSALCHVQQLIANQPATNIYLASSHADYAAHEIIAPDEPWLSEKKHTLFAVDAHEAALSASLFHGTDGTSRAESSTICHVDLGADAVRAAVFKEGQLVDQACLGIGSQFMTVAADGEVTAVSEGGDTFIDGVAKTAPIGEVLPAEKIELLCLLMGEVIAHFLHDRKPPQITQRLLVSEKLKQDHRIQRYILSGGIFSLPAADSDSALASSVGYILRRTVLESFGERDMRWEVGRLPLFAVAAGLRQCRDTA